MDKEAFRRALGLKSEDTIYALLVDRKGEVLWQAEGKRTDDKVQQLTQVLDEHVQRPEGKMVMHSMKRPKATAGTEIATLGGGCFWCLEAVYQELEGVLKVVSGYSGGSVPNPTYQQVCSGTTGHAEVVQLIFDPEVISYREILEVFFTIHDPTTLNRQGADVGMQYRSVVFYHSPEQKSVAEALIRELEEAKVWSDPIVTQVVPFEAFYRAEDYHQNYFRRNPQQGYCQFIIAPKLEKFRKRYQERLKSAD